VEIEPGHFVLGNTQELNQYRKMCEEVK